MILRGMILPCCGVVFLSAMVSAQVPEGVCKLRNTVGPYVSSSSAPVVVGANTWYTSKADIFSNFFAASTVSYFLKGTIVSVPASPSVTGSGSGVVSAPNSGTATGSFRLAGVGRQNIEISSATLWHPLLGAFLVDTTGTQIIYVTVASTIAGDLDRDGDVDFADFTAFTSFYGNTYSSNVRDAFYKGDFDLDGDVDLADFITFQNNM